jgi:hypothetical protein
MKPPAFVVAIIAPCLLAGALAGCSTWQGHQGAASAARNGTSQSRTGLLCGAAASAGGGGSAGTTGSGPGSEQMGSGMTGDQAAMCELNRRIAIATPDQRQAMLEQYLPGMSPDLREQHLAMMREQCQ